MELDARSEVLRQAGSWPVVAARTSPTRNIRPTVQGHESDQNIAASSGASFRTAVFVPDANRQLQNGPGETVSISQRFAWHNTYRSSARTLGRERAGVGVNERTGTAVVQPCQSPRTGA